MYIVLISIGRRDSLIRALMRARQSSFVAVIDLHYMRDHCAGSLHIAKTLNLQPVSKEGRTIDYHSGGEYLVWGMIPKPAVLSVM